MRRRIAVCIAATMAAIAGLLVATVTPAGAVTVSVSTMVRCADSYHPVTYHAPYDRGASVATVQMILNTVWVTRTRVDGDYGPATFSAIKSFQRGHGLTPDGWVGRNTWNALTDGCPRDNSCLGFMQGMSR